MPSKLSKSAGGTGDGERGADIGDANGEDGTHGTGTSSGAWELMWDWIRELWRMR